MARCSGQWQVSSCRHSSSRDRCLPGGELLKPSTQLGYIRAVQRVGSGVDVHAFAEGVPLWLGGIHIPHPRGLAGHSDGDAALHALVDALLGATGRGDIGEWFPSTDARFRGVRSTELLRQVWTDLSSYGWHLDNADLTIVAS